MGHKIRLSVEKYSEPSAWSCVSLVAVLKYSSGVMNEGLQPVKVIRELQPGMSFTSTVKGPDVIQWSPDVYNLPHTTTLKVYKYSDSELTVNSPVSESITSSLASPTPPTLET